MEMDDHPTTNICKWLSKRAFYNIHDSLSVSKIGCFSTTNSYASLTMKAKAVFFLTWRSEDARRMSHGGIPIDWTQICGPGINQQYRWFPRQRRQGDSRGAAAAASCSIWAVGEGERMGGMSQSAKHRRDAQRRRRDPFRGPCLSTYNP
jgi:hypothetical protein